MGQSLNVASEKRGYILADRGTYLALKKRLDLASIREGTAHIAEIDDVVPKGKRRKRPVRVPPPTVEEP